MSTLDFVVLALLVSNLVLFVVLGSWGLVQWVRCASAHLRHLGLLVAIVCATFVLGAIHRLGLQADRLGFASADMGDLLLADVQLVKALAASVLALACFYLLHRVRTSLGQVDRLVAALTDRVTLPSGLDDLRLTPRELDVLALIGRGWTTDEEIGDHLHVSPATSRTHVRNILGKTGLRSRRELILFAHSRSVGEPAA